MVIILIDATSALGATIYLYKYLYKRESVLALALYRVMNVAVFIKLEKIFMPEMAISP